MAQLDLNISTNQKAHSEHICQLAVNLPSKWPRNRWAVALIGTSCNQQNCHWTGQIQFYMINSWDERSGSLIIPPVLMCHANLVIRSNAISVPPSRRRAPLLPTSLSTLLKYPAALQRFRTFTKTAWTLRNSGLGGSTPNVSKVWNSTSAETCLLVNLYPSRAICTLYLLGTSGYWSALASGATNHHESDWLHLYPD